MHLKKLPGNKISTIIKGFIGNEIDLIELSKILKKSCGVGGTVKDDIILLQGNQRNKIKEILFKRGFKVKISGG